LGEKLRQIRASLELTLEQMIKRLGYKDSPIYPTNISATERGEREPPLTLLLYYARLAGISTDVLIDDETDIPQRLPARPKSEVRGGKFNSRKNRG